MQNKILTFALGLMMIGASVFAQDVSIDGNGNMTTGSSNGGANLEVTGSSGEDGVVGSASGTGASGVYGINTDSNNYGTLGHSDYGVYGSSSSGAAGFFQGNAEVTGNLTVGGTISGSISASETDPVFSVWDRSTGVSITESQITDLSHFTTGDETDPQVGTLTNAKWCTSNGLQVNCTSDAPSGGGGVAYARYAVVAKSGGDYITPITAMSDLGIWCGTPTETTPCLLKIMPGVYSVTPVSLQMQSYVDIEGSGENVTKITGSLDSASNGVVNGASNTEIRFITVENTGTGTNVNAIFNNGVSPKITNVTARVTGGSYGTGVNNRNSANPVISKLTVTVSGAGYSFGIDNYLSSPILNDVSIDSAGTIEGYGIQNISSTLVIRNSKVKGNTNSFVADGTALVFNSQLIGTVSGPPLSITCNAVYDATYKFYATTCP